MNTKNLVSIITLAICLFVAVASFGAVLLVKGPDYSWLSVVVFACGVAALAIGYWAFTLVGEDEQSSPMLTTVE